MKTHEMELGITDYFNPRINLVIPNVSWGFNCHECDLLILTKTGCLYEVEIKTSLSDLKKDLKKEHKHRDERIKYLYFAIPKNILDDCLYYIPSRAGIIICEYNYINKNVRAKLHRKPESNSTYVCNETEKYKLARLGALRIWNLKRKLLCH